MQTQMQTSRGFGQDVSVHVPQRGAAQAKYIFFAGDLIAPSVKAMNPDWSAGGALRPGALTLSYRGHYIRQCEITPLRQHMEGMSAANVAPGERRHMVSKYQMSIGGEVKEYGVKPNGEPDGLLRVAFYPIDEVGILTGQVDGVVEMPVTNAAEQVRAQMFLFPNWEDIAEGRTKMPEKLGDLRLYFQKRLKAAQETGDTFLIGVVNAAIASCINFQTWGQQQVNVANGMYDEAKTKGWAWGYGADAEMLFTQLGIQRRDNAVQDQGAKLDKLIEAIASGQQATAPQPAAPVIDDETKGLLAFLRESKQDIVDFVKQRKGLVSPEPTQAVENTAETTIIDDSPIQAGEAVFVDVGAGLDRVSGIVSERRSNGRLVVELEDGTSKSFEKKQVERK